MDDQPCTLCGSTEADELYPSTLDASGPRLEDFRCTSLGYGRHPSIVRCRSCGLIYALPRMSPSQIQEAYRAAEDPDYVAEREGRVLTFHRNLAPVERWLGSRAPGRLLDVGCHVGVLLEVARERGWEVWGVEPSRWAAERAQAKGLRVFCGTLREAGFPNAWFDAVTLWDVVEHLTDPQGELEGVWRILKPEGIVAIHTMDIESPLARLLGPRWPWLMEMHLFYFSPRTLGRLIQELGFEVLEILHQGRYLRLGYLFSRLEPFVNGLSPALVQLVKALGLAPRPISVNLGDLFTLIARKPSRP